MIKEGLIIVPEGFKILFAEDNPINQRIAVLSLKRLGTSCDIAANGNEALEKYIANKYNLIFMDMQMPVLNGVDAAVKIREFEKANKIEKQVWIVAVTANSFSDDREECFNAGMNDFINKPFSEFDLKRVIGKCLQDNSLIQ
ncbi:MAG: response regulator [Prolixibacteraceae bacterium]|jgi:CheY-like chemotaxis protein|nr:response regulator [Prolixibacteraceae bacterium]